MFTCNRCDKFIAESIDKMITDDYRIVEIFRNSLGKPKLKLLCSDCLPKLTAYEKMRYNI